MTWKAFSASAIAAFAFFMAGPGPLQAQDASQPTNHCDRGDKIDGSTANDARKKLEAAGYIDVTQLNKGCDNVWHAVARANGNVVNVMVAPDGSVHQETN
ncbi:MAG TPA: hypothetical protein VMT54_21875 [Candidatus Cybelea sp.]|nr:hypothetical protein [Candidatus Cybelea sp.]